MSTTRSKSPFPGMDPFIEARGLWADFHHILITEIRSALVPLLPDNYVVRTQERGYISLVGVDEKEEHAFVSDVGLTGLSDSGRIETDTEAVAVAVETDVETDPISLRPFIADQFREAFIEIYALEPERELVTCIEVLSPSNKRRKSKGWKIYQRKRQAMLLGKANFIEIDLLRGGSRMPMLDPWPKSPYSILVSRQVLAPSCRVWPAYAIRPLPAFSVPLNSPDPAVTVELQPLVDAVYASSRYAHSIDYTKIPPFPLTPAEIALLPSPASAGSAPR